MKSVASTVCFSLLLTSCGTTNTDPVGLKSVISSDNKEYAYADGMELDKFIVNNLQDFKKFEKVIIYSSQFDKLKISTSADKDLAKSWNTSSWKEMDAICQHLDDLTQKVFRDRKEYAFAEQGAEDVLALQFTLMDFMPISARYRDSGNDTVGASVNYAGIGVITVRGVLANAKTGELVGLVEETMEVNSGATSTGAGSLAFAQDSNNKTAQNLAWRKSFRSFVENFHDDLVRLKYADVSAVDKNSE
ncbi:MAG TPA: hypothetical protein VIC08_14255 [Cellvibrionaceae bacterium]